MVFLGIPSNDSTFVTCKAIRTQRDTPPKFNSSPPEKWWLEDYVKLQGGSNIVEERTASLTGFAGRYHASRL